MIEQLLCHLGGDYVLQSDYCALNKSKKSWNCFVHVLIYTACFLFITTSWKVLLVIGAVHFILDRWHTILKHLIWWKNHFPKGYPEYGFCDSTGYFDDSPYNRFSWTYIGKFLPDLEKEMIEKYGKPRHFFITIWIYIAIDNFFHLLTNYLAIRYLS